MFDIIRGMKFKLKKYEVLVEHTEVARIVVYADSIASAECNALECERRGDVESSSSISFRCIGCRELIAGECHER